MKRYSLFVFVSVCHLSDLVKTNFYDSAFQLIHAEIRAIIFTKKIKLYWNSLNRVE